ncbi:MAG: magnesium chelatase, partial [Bacteroidota bacterium]|nr:magnesium chelatase [Bacteroidota bacterium]
SFGKLSEKQQSESSEEVRKRVEECRSLQDERFKDVNEVYCNAQMNTKLLRKHCQIDEEGQALLKTAMEKLGLSARAYDRILKVSRTIADLEKNDKIQADHLAEAIQYRSLDRENWAG